MSKKTKRYLMLLVAVGILAVAAGGSGTFASFSAEVSNNNNIFTSGTLFLHNTVNGGTACASESASDNANIGTPYTANNGCTTLFSTTLPTGGATLGGAGFTSGNPVTTLTVTPIHGSAIQIGDEILLDNGTDPAQRFYATAQSNPGTTSITVATQNAAANFPAGTTTVTDDARFVPVQITNAGSLDASGISVALGPGGCNNSAAVTTSNTGTGTASGTTLTLGSPLVNGVPSGTSITIAGPNPETVTTSAPGNPGDGTLTVSALGFTHSAAAITWAVGFTGGTTNLCTALPITIVETNSAFRHDSGVSAVGCAYPAANVVANYGCTFSATAIGSLPVVTSSLQALTLGSNANSNTLGQLDASRSRYFVIGIQSPGSLGNGSQNRQAKFDLVWRIDQA